MYCSDGPGGDSGGDSGGALFMNEALVHEHVHERVLVSPRITAVLRI